MDVLQAVDTGNTVTDGKDTTSFIEAASGDLTEDALLDDAGHFGTSASWGRGVDVSGGHIDADWGVSLGQL